MLKCYTFNDIMIIDVDQQNLSKGVDSEVSVPVIFMHLFIL